jgi:hypothetical protein
LFRQVQPGIPPQPLPFVTTQTGTCFLGTCWGLKNLTVLGNIHVDHHVKRQFLRGKQFSARIYTINTNKVAIGKSAATIHLGSLPRRIPNFDLSKERI